MIGLAPAAWLPKVALAHRIYDRFGATPDSICHWASVTSCSSICRVWKRNCIVCMQDKKYRLIKNQCLITAKTPPPHFVSRRYIYIYTTLSSPITLLPQFIFYRFQYRTIGTARANPISIYRERKHLTPSSRQLAQYSGTIAHYSFRFA